MKRYLVGIDGGASRSRAILTDLKGRQLSSAEGRSLNPLSLGWNKFRDHFRRLLSALMRDHPSGEVLALCAGLAGTGDEEVRSRAQKEIEALVGSGKVYVISDALAALWGAFRGQPGLLLIAGTGSICVGMDRRGNTARSGGFGRLLGDEGGGYWIALEAVRSALRQIDGRDPVVSLSTTVCQEFDLDDPRDLIAKLSGGKLPPERLARFAKEVLRLSATNSDAGDIIRRAGRHLADLLVATAKKLSLKRPRVVLWGGLWDSAGRELQHSLSEALLERDFIFEFGAPHEPPEWGAIRYLQSLTA